MTRTLAKSLILGLCLSAFGCSSNTDNSTESAGGSSGASGASTGGKAAGGSGAGGAQAGAGGAAAGSGGGPVGPRFIGRFTDSHQAAWSASTIELSFTGTDISVTMGGSEWYEVVMDGTPTTMQISGTAVLGTGLSNGPHLLQIVRRAEAFNGVGQFMSFSVPDSAMLPQVIPGRGLEVIGDSVAVAYGFGGCADRTNKDENAYQSWGYIAARALKADLHLLGQSGIGMAINL
ncbi:MAG TPA: hypothetical protein VGP93_04580, partial [Polyangiaceae bacterium]|nr:hypothetical protein [Polyangiaceae bacterium]